MGQNAINSKQEDTSCTKMYRAGSSVTQPTVLLVDQEPAILFTFQMALAKYGYTVETERSSENTVEKATSQCYQAIIVNAHRPDPDGSELVGQLRQAGVDAPILIITSSIPQEIERAEFEPISVGYLERPLEPEALRAALNGLIK